MLDLDAEGKEGVIKFDVDNDTGDILAGQWMYCTYFYYNNAAVFATLHQLAISAIQMTQVLPYRLPLEMMAVLWSSQPAMTKS